MSADQAVEHMIRVYGAWGVGGVVALESLGVPAPGETLVVAAALYAAQGGLSIWAVVAASAAGAIIGDNIGYLIGARLGNRLLDRLGRHVGLTEPRLRLGRYLLQRYGDKLVFFGRFVGILRTFAAVLAGAGRMAWRRFLVANALVGITWAALYGFGAYLIGDEAKEITGTLGVALALAAAVVLALAFRLIHRHAARLLQEAEAAARQPDA